MTNMEYWYWINNIEAIGRDFIRQLLEKFDTPKNVFCAKESEVQSILGSGKRFHYFLESKDVDKISKECEDMKAMGISFIDPTSDRYPDRLKEIPDAPYGLYLLGQLPDKNQKTVAIIGARNASRYGMEMARFFGRELAKCGVAVISGLARGTDGNAHRGALEGNGYTLGVLGCGIDQVYPNENYDLYMMMKQNGGIISEHNVGVAPRSGLFPQRNRIIAGMSDGILVVEAKEKSGTFITVDQGLEYGKDIFAIPGRITDEKSVGCNNLIKYGAYVVTDINDILQIIDGKKVKENVINCPLEAISKKNLLAPLEKIVYDCLRIEARYLDDIIEESQVAPQDVCKALNTMALNGIVSEPARNYFAIKI